MERYSPRKALLRSIDVVARDTLVYRVELDEPLPFKAGQFVNLAEPGAKPRGERSYSIYSDPASPGVMDFCIKLFEGGAASEYLRVRQVGDVLDIRGPFGVFTLPDEIEPVTFVATGTGLAPFHSMLLEQERLGNRRRFRLFFGVRSEEDVFAVATLQRWKQSLNFDYTLCLSRPGAPEAMAEGCVIGRVTQAMADHQPEGHWYLCGNGSMIEEVRTLLKEKGLDRKQIHVEKYY
ncbi:MAG TPA: FAD-binding oxidoreductase [Myxococcota bacterium]|nr:FAD-binding oxidoreductase [Myxococcota bacterium]